jgi:hypothetical protein
MSLRLFSSSLLDSKKAGNTLHTLQVGKGEDAEGLYKKIGFETDHTTVWLVKEI